MTTPGRAIILIMVDQLAAKWLEAATECEIVELPNFTAMRTEGANFTRAFTPNPVCSPARASLATGMPTSSHGVSECGYKLDPEVPTFMQGLQSNGWLTGAFGKLHFLPQIAGVAPDYHPYGFDVTQISEDPRAGAWLDWVRDHHPEHYQAAQSTVWMTMVEGLAHYGLDDTDLAAEIRRANQVFPASTEESYVLPFPAEVSQTAWITDRACDFIATAGGRDVFAQISYVQPHNPFSPPAEYVDRVAVEAIPEPIPAEWLDTPIPYYQQERYSEPSYATRDWRRDRQLYFADLAHLDHELGRIRGVLAEQDRSDALVIFTADHGELLHDHGLLGKWERHYDPCIRVPLIITAPSIKPAVCSALVDLTDIATTIYDWADVPHPCAAERRHGEIFGFDLLSGRSLLPLLNDPQAPWRDQLLVQSNNSHVEASPRSWARTLRTDRYRFTRHFAGGGEQLFDLTQDPAEQQNLALCRDHDRLRTELLTRLTEQNVIDGYPNSPRQLFQIGAW